MSEIVFPSYYKDFHCIAGLCRHTCCRGWEIGVDKDSLARFKNTPDISRYLEGKNIRLEANGDCPFLEEDGLCRMIKTHGEDFLCDICREHPRFYFRRGGKTYGGIGLCCEEACRVVLDCTTNAYSDMSGSFPEIADFIGFEGDIAVKMASLWSRPSGAKMRAVIFEQMESMDEQWSRYLATVKSNPPTSEEENGILIDNCRVMENFAAYMLYRHDGNRRMAAECTLLIADIVSAGAEIHEAARMFSQEIEYSDVNMETSGEVFNGGI